MRASLKTNARKTYLNLIAPIVEHLPNRVHDGSSTFLMLCKTRKSHQIFIGNAYGFHMYTVKYVNDPS